MSYLFLLLLAAVAVAFVLADFYTFGRWHEKLLREAEQNNDLFSLKMQCVYGISNSRGHNVWKLVAVRSLVEACGSEEELLRVKMNCPDDKDVQNLFDLFMKVFQRKGIRIGPIVVRTKLPCDG